jgi:hypothetical protein
MANSILTKFGSITVPGGYVSYSVQQARAGLATSGILMLVGEADEGMDYSEETDLQENAFGPEQIADVIAKYQSGPLVDAFRAATSPLSDPSILGSFTAAVLVKTNAGTKASATLATAYGTLYAKLAGKSGSQIQYQILSETAEGAVTTGSFTYIPNVGAIDYAIRISGAADLVSGTDLSADTTPTVLVSTIAALAGVAATGGADRGILTGLATGSVGSLALAVVSGNTITLTLSVASAWATTPTVGDTLTIPTGSIVAGAADANVGAYVITAATSLIITATKLSDAGKSGATPGTVTAPVAVSVADITATTDAKAWSPVTISLDTSSVVPGVGKSLEIGALTNASTDTLYNCFYDLGTTTRVDWLSTSTTPVVVSSAAETEIAVEVSKNSLSEDWTCGGEIALNIGYTGTTATLTIAEDVTVADQYNLTTAVVGGSGANLSLNLSDYANLQELADYIDSQTGYSCSVGSAILGFLPADSLDRVTTKAIATSTGAETGRIKIDAYRFVEAVTSNSTLVQFGSDADGLPERANLGLPDVMTAAAFLAGGARGSTTNANIVAAIDALQDVRGNFLVPLFSRDATDDIADGLTSTSSTYTIAAINAAASAHVTLMSTLKRRGNRQALISLQDTFANQKEAASNVGNFRCCMTFQNFKQLNSAGNIETFQPWMGGVLAAAGQAAAFYKDITNKIIVTSGITQDAGDYNSQSYTQEEQALESGLLPAWRSDAGGYRWVSDQTTYGSDSNFVFNSLQTTYVADIVALSTARSMQAAFLGQATSDVTAAAAKSYLINLLESYYQAKLLTASDDGAPHGYKNVQVRIVGNAMYVSAEIKVTTGIKFIIIDFYISQSTQSA